MAVNEHYNKTDPLTRLPYHCAALLSFLSEVTVCGAERETEPCHVFLYQRVVLAAYKP